MLSILSFPDNLIKFRHLDLTNKWLQYKINLKEIFSLKENMNLKNFIQKKPLFLLV